MSFIFFCGLRVPSQLVRCLAAVAIQFTLSACSIVPPSKPKENARLTPTTRFTRDLTRLPEPKYRIPVAVYAFRDQTGQYKQSPDSAYSTAVSQGAASMLVIALRESGWFLPVEREGLQNLLTERRIVRAIESPSDKGKPAISLPNLTPASLLVEGGIVAYESNVRTGGKGANYLGIGASTQYRVDQVTVVLRSVDIKSGHVLNSVSATKTIYSFQFDANIYKFVAYQKLLQGEAGFTTNEPAQMALKEAIELAVIQLTVDGIRDRNLALKRPEDWGSPIVQAYAAADNANFADAAQPSKDFVPMRPRESERRREGSGNQPFDASGSLGWKESGSATDGAVQATTESARVTKPAPGATQAGVQPIPPAQTGAESPAKPAVVATTPAAPAAPAATQPAAQISATPPRPSEEVPRPAAAAAAPVPVPAGAPEKDDIFQSYWRKR